MFAPITSALMIASLVIAQNPLPNPAAAPAAQQVPAPLVAPPITVPAGTAIPLTLMNAVKSKSTKPGDTVRAVVAFPVTVGSRLAIPTGTFVEGTVTQVTARPLKNQVPTLRVHFTRLLFANGYSVALNGENTQSFLLPNEDRALTVEVAELAPMPLAGPAFCHGCGTGPTHADAATGWPVERLWLSGLRQGALRLSQSGCCCGRTTARTATILLSSMWDGSSRWFSIARSHSMRLKWRPPRRLRARTNQGFTAT